MKDIILLIILGIIVLLIISKLIKDGVRDTRLAFAKDEKDKNSEQEVKHDN